MADDIELIDSTTVEELASVSRRTVDRLEKQGRFPKRIRIGYRTVRWVRSEVEAWIKEQVNRRRDGGPQGTVQGDHNGDHADHSRTTTNQE